MLRGDSLRQTTIDNFNALRGNTNVSNAKGERFTNCLSNPSLCVFFCGHFPPKHQKKKNVHPSENATLHPITL